MGRGRVAEAGILRDELSAPQDGVFRDWAWHGIIGTLGRFCGPGAMAGWQYEAGWLMDGNADAVAAY